MTFIGERNLTYTLKFRASDNKEYWKMKREVPFTTKFDPHESFIGFTCDVKKYIEYF